MGGEREQGKDLQGAAVGSKQQAADAPAQALINPAWMPTPTPPGQDQQMIQPAWMTPQQQAAASGPPQQMIQPAWAPQGGAAAAQSQPLSQLDPGLVALAKGALGADLSYVTVSVIPQLQSQGKHGMAQGGERIGLSPAVMSNPRPTLAHELIHIAQHPRSGVPHVALAPTDIRLDIEQEADAGAVKILAGQAVKITNSIGDEPHFKDPVTSAADQLTGSTVVGTVAGLPKGPGGILADKIRAASDPDIIVELVRSASKIARESSLVVKAIEDQKGILSGKMELLNLILAHGPEPLWDHSVLSANIDLVPDGVTGNLLELNEGYRDPDASRDSDGHRVTKKEKMKVEVAIFPGVVSDIVILEGGIHGTETSGQELCDAVLEDLKTSPVKPYYTVVVVRALFPDNEKHQKRHVDKATGLPSSRTAISACNDKSRKCIGTNRNYPGTFDSDNKVTSVTSLADSKNSRGIYKDANGEDILPETAAFIALTEKLKPVRIISIHGTERIRAMVAVDGMIPPDPIKDTENKKLTCESAEAIRSHMGNTDAIQGNVCAPASCLPTCTTMWEGVGAPGISQGGYFSALGITIFTVEITEEKDKATREKEVLGYKEGIARLFQK